MTSAVKSFSRRSPSAASFLVFVTITVVTVLLSLWMASGVGAERRSMLQERTRMAALVVGNLFGGQARSLSYLEATSSPTGPSSAGFVQAAKSLAGASSTIAAVRPDGAQLTVAVSTGPQLPTGTALQGESAALVDRAIGAKDFVAGLVHVGSTRRLAFALRTQGGLVLYQIFSFDLSHALSTGGAQNPFSDLRGALYAAPTADPSQLLLADTSQVPIRGQVDRQNVNVGASSWLIVARSNGPLVGSITAAAPWGALGAGLLAAFLATGIIEILARRRRYAVALADQRTVELQEALARQRELERDERDARQVAEAANRSKSEFLSRVSHELRTPLNAVLGFGQLLELDELTESQQESVTQIVKGGRHLLGLINEVLDISRIETGNLALSVEPVPTAELIDEVATLMRPLADGRNVELVVLPTGSAESHVLADHQRLKQVMLNLLSNAIKYNRAGGSVTLSVEASGGQRVRLVVADTGPGIPAENLDRLFLPFERLGAERTDIEGTGVGLALSRRLAEAMAGDLEVDSTVGQGSRFWIELPRSEDPLDHLMDRAPAPPRPDSVTGGSPHRKILYIEDNPPNIRLVERILAQRPELEVLSAMQGRLGVSLAQEHHPALILLDVHLPDIGGDEVLRLLHAAPATAQIPVIVLSADATNHRIERLIEQGAASYLTKPIDVHELLAVVDQHVSVSAAGWKS